MKKRYKETPMEVVGGESSTGAKRMESKWIEIELIRRTTYV